MAACSSPTDDKHNPVKKTVAVTKPLIPPGEEKPCFLPEYDLKMVEASAKTAAPARLSATIVAKMVRRNPDLPVLFKEYNEYGDLYALDTVRCKDFIIVSYLYRHEDCCSDVYYLSFAAEGKRLIDWAAIARTGADGMWSATATMNSQPDLRLRITGLAKDSEDGVETSFQDSVVTDYSITPQGRFVHTRIDSVRTRQSAK